MSSASGHGGDSAGQKRVTRLHLVTGVTAGYGGSMSGFADLDGDELIEGRAFFGLEAAGETLSDRELFRCTFRGARLAQSRFERCTFEACVLEDCDLTRFVPLRTALRGVTFRSCKLLGAELSALAENPEVTFESCDLRYASLRNVNLRGTRFIGCDLGEATFVDCSLVNATFDECDLRGASFGRCAFSGADLSTSHSVFLDVRANDVKGAFVPLETAVLLAQSAGLAVAGYDDRPKRKQR